MADGAEEPAVPALIGLQLPLVAVLDRLERAGPVGEVAAFGRTLPVDRDVEQAGEINVGRGQHDTHLAAGQRLDRGSLDQPVMVRRRLIILRGLQAGDHVGRSQLLARPERHVVPQRKGERCPIARIRCA